MNLSAQEVRALLQRAVDEKGADYVYPKPDGNCYYRNPKDGTPSCLVGHVVGYMGRLDQIASMDNSSTIDFVAETTPILNDVEDGRIIIALSEAQYIQDDGGTWGEALAAFDEALSEGE